jgi:lipopolysaccharide transport system ATP-binding protein
MFNNIISVENLSKRYLIGHQANERVGWASLRDVIGREARNFTRKTVDLFHGRQIVQGDEVEEFWALRDVSFDVRQGEVVGVIGRNGAGKSTLLKILSRITEPTAGVARLRGRVGSLLEVGTGFHPELTGRENIFLNGAILGMKQAEIKFKLDNIVDFAGVELFLDTPVKRYSSGMYVRLAFSIAAHLEPEILIVDEVLAVGDAEFQKKCLGKISEVARGGRTVLFVSHNMAAVENLCDRCIALRSGQIVSEGKPQNVITDYFRECQPSNQRILESIERKGDGTTRFSEIILLDAKDQCITSAATGELIRIKLVTTGILSGAACRVSIGFSNVYGVALFVCSTELTSRGTDFPAECKEIICEIPRLPLSAGRYLLTLFIEQNGVISDWIEDGVELTVDDRDFFGSGKNAPVGWEGKTVLVDHSWHTPTAKLQSRQIKRAAHS